MVFDVDLVLTGLEKRMNKDKSREYMIARFLNEDGKTFDALVDESCIIPDGIKQLDRVKVTFKVITGKFINLRVLELCKI